MGIARKDPNKKCDIREVVYLDHTLKEFTSLYCHERGKSFSELVRMSLKFYKRYLETELSKQNQSVNSDKVGTNSAQSPFNQNGLYTAEQVAQLINAMRAEK